MSMRNELNTLFEAVGLSEETYRQPLFSDLFAAGLTIGTFGENPIDILEEDSYPDANFSNTEFCQRSKFLDFNSKSVLEDGYVIDALDAVWEKVDKYKAKHMGFTYAPMLISVACARAIFEEHPEYRALYEKYIEDFSDAYNIAMDDEITKRFAVDTTTKKPNIYERLGGCMASAIGIVAVAIAVPIAVVAVVLMLL